MNKNVFIALLVTAGLLVLPAASFAADKKTAAPAAEKAAAKMPVPPKANFGMLVGTIASINSADPANIKLEVKNTADGSMRTVLVTPWTNITKVTDASELKTGDPIRMMTRKTDDKDVAMGIMFGKIKAIPASAQKAPKAPQASPVKAKK
ncbi:MAG: hypothetical protein Q7S07_05755 [Candidatus Omnitrophota bacterium]|nr:hypothetical protein [Candidatus Omnitrophota bacterium]